MFPFFLFSSFLFIAQCKPLGLSDLLLGGAPMVYDHPIDYNATHSIPPTRTVFPDDDQKTGGTRKWEDDSSVVSNNEIIVPSDFTTNDPSISFSSSSLIVTGWEGQDGVNANASDVGGLKFEEFVRLNRCKANIAILCFNDADLDGNGMVSERELMEYNFESNKRANEQHDIYVNAVMNGSDTNGDRFISRDEAKNLAENELKVLADESFYNLFNDSDENLDGKLDVDELRKLIRAWYRNDYILQLHYNDYATTTESGTVSKEYPDGDDVESSTNVL